MLATRVHVESCFFHCAKAFKRSHLWQPESWPENLRVSFLDLGVVSHPYFAVTGADGRFRFANVPPGSYTLAAWHPKLERQEQHVEVDPRLIATARFRFGPP